MMIPMTNKLLKFRVCLCIPGQTIDKITELHYLNVFVEMIHDASGVRRHE